MPITRCPNCGKDVQFLDSFHGNEIACPNPACRKPVLLPYADGTFPSKEPPKPVGSQPAAAYYLRKPDAPDVVVGPLPRSKIRQMALTKRLELTDQLSEDRTKWRPAMNRDPALFDPPTQCAWCGTVTTDDRELCPRCEARPPEGPDEAGTYGLKGGTKVTIRALTGRVERHLVAPERLVDLFTARAADAIVGVGTDGWLGLWEAGTEALVRSWHFDPGPRTRVAVADRGGLAVLATGDRKTTRLSLVDFHSKRLHKLTEIDGEVRALGMDPDGKYLALVDDRPEVRIYKVDPWKRLDKFAVEGAVFEFCLAQDRLAAADDEGRVELWDLRAAKVDRELRSPGGNPACPRRPLRLGFSRTGHRVFAAAGLVVQFPKKYVGEIDPTAAAVIGGVLGAAGGALGFVLGARKGIRLSANVPVLWEHYRNAREATLEGRLARGTALRSWDLDGGLAADVWYLFEHHRDGIADAYLWPAGSAAVTVGPTAAHAWDLATGNHLTKIYDVTDEGEAARAKDAARPDLAALPDHPPLIRRVAFTHDGEHALVLVCGDKTIRMIPWPQEGADEGPAFVGER